VGGCVSGSFNVLLMAIKMMTIDKSHLYCMSVALKKNDERGAKI
jgi:hypothetical protein